MSLLIQLEFKVRPGREAEFLLVARALAKAAAIEPGTLRYEWFTTQKPGHFAIIEEYVNADAAELHNNNVAALLTEMFGLVDLVTAAFYGELNQYIREWVTGREGITVHRPLD
ncbi:MAG TPA: antibiotic biosynthesis monooxygenase [Kofleriaceae bacterium]